MKGGSAGEFRAGGVRAAPWGCSPPDGRLGAKRTKQPEQRFQRLRPEASDQFACVFQHGGPCVPFAIIPQATREAIPGDAVKITFIKWKIMKFSKL